MSHVVTLEVLHLADPGPLMTLRQSCSCGGFLTEHHVNAQDESRGLIEAYGDADALSAIDHLQAQGGGTIVYPRGLAVLHV